MPDMPSENFYAQRVKGRNLRPEKEEFMFSFDILSASHWASIGFLSSFYRFLLKEQRPRNTQPKRLRHSSSNPSLGHAKKSLYTSIFVYLILYIFILYIVYLYIVCCIYTYIIYIYMIVV